ncbi:MAG: TIGR04283 family arsenosugar biosynthesis glycosyltransferase [Verrucomicrobiota bacterium]
MSDRLAIVIPTLNEAANIPFTLASVREGWADAEVVVADGGSTDDTGDLASAFGAKVCRDLPKSRGSQLRAGAREAGDVDWLLFLHADTRLDEAAVEAAKAYMTSANARLAMFQLRFDDASRFLRFSAWWTRFDSVFTRFGDQGILVTRSAYEALGGFRAIPLFEDVDLLRRARKTRPIDVLPASVTTSSRRFRTHGIWRQQLHNAVLLLRFLAGVSPEKLVRNYPPAAKL